MQEACLFLHLLNYVFVRLIPRVRLELASFITWNTGLGGENKSIVQLYIVQNILQSNMSALFQRVVLKTRHKENMTIIIKFFYSLIRELGYGLIHKTSIN